MNDTIFEPFGEAVPVAAHTSKDTGIKPVSETGMRLYKAALITFWLVVAVIVIARVMYHGNIFAFGG